MIHVRGMCQTPSLQWGNVEKQAEWYRTVLPVLCHLCQSTKDQTGKKLLPRKMTGRE